MSEFKPHLKSPKKRFQMSAGLNLKKIEYNFKCNQPYLSLWWDLDFWNCIVAIICLESWLADTHYITKDYRGLHF